MYFLPKSQQEMVMMVCFQYGTGTRKIERMEKVLKKGKEKKREGKAKKETG